MADIRTAFRAAIAADSGVIAILGADPLPRIFAPVLPPGTDISATPALTIQKALIAPEAQQMGGPQLKLMHRFQVTAFAERVSDTEALSAAVISALDALSGTFDTIAIEVIRYVAGTGFDDYDPDTQTHSSIMDFEVQL